MTSPQEEDRDSEAPRSQPPGIPPLHPEEIPAHPADIRAAEKEAQGFADGTLEDIARRRRNTIQEVWHRLKVAFMLLLGGILFIAVLVAAFHMLSPTYWHFLSVQQLNSLYTMLGSSMVTGLATAVGRSILRDVGPYR